MTTSINIKDTDKIVQNSKYSKDSKDNKIIKKNSCYDPTNANRIVVLRRLLTLSYPELLRITCGISALIVNSLTNLSFPW